MRNDLIAPRDAPRYALSGAACGKFGTLTLFLFDARPSIYRNLLSDFKRHQVLSDLQGAFIGLPSFCEDIGSGRRRNLSAGEKHEMRIDGELRSRACKDASGLARCCVVRHDPLHVGFRPRVSPERTTARPPYSMR